MLEEWTDNFVLKSILKKNPKLLPPVSDRKVWDNINPNLKKYLIKNGESYLEFAYPALKATSFMKFKNQGERILYEIPYFERRSALHSLVTAELVENQGRFLPDIINGIWAICEETTWSLSAHIGMAYHKAQSALPDVNDHILDLFATETASSLSVVLALLGDCFDTIDFMISKRIRDELSHRILNPFILRNDFLWMNQGFNWNSWCSSNIILTALLCESDEFRRVMIIEKAIKSLDFMIKKYPNDGGCNEGISYWSHSGACIFEVLDYMYTATDGNIDFFKNKKILNICDYIEKVHLGADKFANFGDASVKPGLDIGLIFDISQKVNNKTLAVIANLSLKSTWKDGDMKVLKERDVEKLYRKIRLIQNFDKVINTEQHYDLRLHSYLEDLQIMTARAKGGFSLIVKGGHNGDSHGHNAVGGFMLYQDENPIFIDVGVGEYTKATFDADERYKIWTMRSSYHNLPVINGCEQQFGKTYRAKDVCCKGDEDISFIRMNLKDAYSSDNITSYERRLELNRRNNEVTIQEHIETVSAGKIEFVFMTAQEPLICEGAVKTGNAVLSYNFSAETVYEKITFNDMRLTPVWGDGVYRLIISTEGVQNVMDYEFKIRMG